MFSEHFSFSGAQVGFLLSADMMAGTVAALLARFWIIRVRWRPILLLSILSTSIANIACVIVDDFTALLVLRCCAGFSAGTMMAFVYATFANVDNADREFAIALAASVAVGAAGLLAAPVLLQNFGPASLFVFVAAASLIPLPLYGGCPLENPGAASAGSSQPRPISPSVLLALTAIGLLFVALTAVWMVMERLGNAEGFDEAVVAAALSGGLLFSFFGAVAPAVTERWLPRRFQVSIAYVALIIAIGIIGSEPGVWAFWLGLCLYNFFYSFIIPFQTAWIASSDRSGRNAVLVPVVQGIGVSAGPMMAGLIMGDERFGGVILAGLTLLVVSFACVLVLDDPLQSPDSSSPLTI